MGVWVVLGVESGYPVYEYYINTHIHMYIYSPNPNPNPIPIPNQKPHPQWLHVSVFSFPRSMGYMYVGSTGSVASSLVTMTLEGAGWGAEEI